jgi:hypothetical protein
LENVNVWGEVNDMQTYEFTFIVSGIDPNDADFENRFFEAGCDDATLALMKGVVAVSFDRVGESFSQAVASAYRDILKVGVTVERFEPDFLVSATEIAERSALTRAAVSNYVRGLRGNGFPAPVARITSESPLWDWVEVAGWLHQKGQVAHEVVVAAGIARDVNLIVQRKNRTAEIDNELARLFA